MEDVQIWEVVDPTTGELLPVGQRGLTVVTNLCSEGSPQLRFQVGDFAVLREDVCSCGRTQRRADGGFCGRQDDMLKIRGVAIFPSAVESILRAMPSLGDEFQIVVSRQSDLDVVNLAVEASRDLPESDYASLQELIRTENRVRLGLDMDVKVVPAGTLPRTEFKAKRVQDTRQR